MITFAEVQRAENLYPAPRAYGKPRRESALLCAVARMGFTNLPSFSTMAAVTFCDVVVSPQQFSDGLLFHELVHVEQFIGNWAFPASRSFMYGDSSGYDGIPLEINAYELGGSLKGIRYHDSRLRMR